MSTAVILPGPGPALPPQTFIATSTVNGIVPGTPVAFARSASQDTAPFPLVQLASAHAGAGKIPLCCGVSLSYANNGQPLTVQWGNFITLTAPQWDAVVTGESGGLTPGDGYFLSDTDGQLSSSKPGGLDSDTPVLIAQSATTALLQLSQPVTTG